MRASRTDKGKESQRDERGGESQFVGFIYSYIPYTGVLRLGSSSGASWAKGPLPIDAVPAQTLFRSWGDEEGTMRAVEVLVQRDTVLLRHVYIL